MQQQPLEDRLSTLENASLRHEQTMARLSTISEHQDELFDRLLANQEALKANKEAIQASQERMDATYERIARLREEVARNAANTGRLWLRLAQRYGWWEDEQNGHL